MKVLRLPYLRLHHRVALDHAKMAVLSPRGNMKIVSSVSRYVVTVHPKLSTFSMYASKRRVLRDLFHDTHYL